MKYGPKKHHRRSIRLKGFNYSRAGAYFVTICTKDRACLLGAVVDGDMRLNEFGEIVREEWLRTEQIRPNVALDTFIVMPNHIHGIIILNGDTRRGTLQRAPTIERFGKPTSNTIPTIIRLFKSITTKRINERRGTRGVPIWQRNYYEHIIRNDDELNQIREYIMTNPLKWEFDRENPFRARQCKDTLQRAPTMPRDKAWHI